MNLFQNPFLQALEGSRSILISGAGGGFDILSGLPLYFALRERGLRVHLANFSFSNLAASTARRITPVLSEVVSTTFGDRNYFPELYLSQWFRLRGEEVPIYAFHKAGVVPIRHAYEMLCAELEIDTIILVDGGTDSLMRGDESGLGTPAEDMVSIAAVSALDIDRTFLVCLGFGIDAYHGVSHADVLEAIAHIIREDGYLGAWSLLHSMPEVHLYRQAVDFIHQSMPYAPSIVSTSIISALDGHFGDHHATERTRGSTLFINPLMALYLCFKLSTVAGRVLYLDRLAETETMSHVMGTIELFRHEVAVRARTGIPL